MYSYTGTNTAMSRVEGLYSDPEEEPLWAVEEDGLSLISEIPMGPINGLTPIENVNATTDGTLIINNEGASWYDDSELMNNINDPKIFIYLTTSKNSVVVGLKGKTGEIFNLDLSIFNNIPTIDLYNYLIIISRKQLIEDTYKGHNYIWISIENPKTDEVLLEGYYNNGQL